MSETLRRQALARSDDCPSAQTQHKQEGRGQ